MSTQAFFGECVHEMIQAAKDDDKIQKPTKKVSKLNLNDITGAHSKWTAGTYEKI